MVGFLVSCFVLGYVVGPMSLMVLVKQKPTLFRPFSAKTIHLGCIIAFIICNLLIYWSGWSIVFKIMILFAIGYVVLYFSKSNKNSFASREKLHFKNGIWTLLYLLGMAFISYFGSFGGTHVISFGMDFAVIGIFSIIIYAIAYAMSTDSIATELSFKQR
ncbi:MAG: hypothetical protein NTZ67_09225 [Gammaproteobacteria bacterium]|nr:hypothetical protein [Gammaproteobacteria bacterium]